MRTECEVRVDLLAMSTEPGAGSAAVDTPPPAAQHVLVVCAANVCRSPSIEFALQRHLESAAPGASWVVTSAGTAARPGDHMCRQSARYISKQPGGRDFAARHQAQLLTLAAVERAALVLVASTPERAAVARLSPSARRRTFTLREATMMMEHISEEQQRGLSLATGASALLPTVVDLLHEQRGTLAISVGPSHLSSRRRRERVSQIDIGDVHQGQERRHKPVLDTVASDARTLAEGIARVSLLPRSSSTERPQLR